MKDREAIEFARHYVKERIGGEVLAEGYTSESGYADLVFREDDALAFAFVKAERGTTLPDDTLTASDRAMFERIAGDWLMGNDVPSCAVRCDTISMAIQGEGKALIRHHRDALSGVGIERASEEKKPAASRHKRPEKRNEPKKEKKAKAQER